MEPAPIRYKNPGAMWGRLGKRLSSAKIVPTNAPIPLKWGSKVTAYLSDGTGQGNNIAIFDEFVNGICAQIDLWRSKEAYRDQPFSAAIRTWSGGNHVESYIHFVLTRVPGMARDTIMDETFWRGPMAVPFLKAQAWHEAGKKYPAPDADFVEARKRFFANDVPVPHQTIVKKAPPKTPMKSSLIKERTTPREPEPNIFKDVWNWLKKH